MEKRLFDFCCASTLLLILSPVLAVVAAAIRLKIGSPVIFKQLRPGLRAQPFEIYKFRTMTDERDAMGNLIADELRLTPLGRFLRRFSLDELPQLVNVIKGELSLVGPRPLLMDYLPRYSPEQARRHNVRPGITGWAQVNGRNALTWEEKFTFDVWYIDHWSFLLDMKILLMTVRKIWKRKGIDSANSVGGAYFWGLQNQTDIRADQLAGQRATGNSQLDVRKNHQWRQQVP